VRHRAATELTLLVAASATYLTLWPERHPALDLGLAVVGLGLVGLAANDTRERIWGSPASPAVGRLRRSAITMTRITLPVLFVFCLFGLWDAYSTRHHWEDVLLRLFPPRFFLALGLYLPWALLQQTLFQFYLLGRLTALFPAASPLGLAILNGILYGAVHLPDRDLALVTAAGGIVWSYVYHRDRSLCSASSVRLRSTRARTCPFRDHGVVHFRAACDEECHRGPRALARDVAGSDRSSSLEVPV
jgi:membrane protease YdiL (CAAX protease family)